MKVNWLLLILRVMDAHMGPAVGVRTWVALVRASKEDRGGHNKSSCECEIMGLPELYLSF